MSNETTHAHGMARDEAIASALCSCGEEVPRHLIFAADAAHFLRWVQAHRAHGRVIVFGAEGGALNFGASVSESHDPEKT